MTLRELYSLGTDILDEAGIESPSVDAFYLLEFLTGMDRGKYLLNKDREVTEDICQRYEEIIEARKSGVPYQYIVGTVDFMGFTIKVNENVLIPRLDTEVLTEEVLKEISPGMDILDMCTGSGCIAIAIKKLAEDCHVAASDISGNALKIAKENARENGAEIVFNQGNLFEGLEDKTFDVIVSNPPYVTEAEYATLSVEVKEHEPKLALTAGEDGLDVYKRLIPESTGHLKRGGVLALEIGCNQGIAVKALMETYGFEAVEIIKDLAGLDRVVKGRRNV